MTKKEYSKAFRLTAREKAQVWYEIREPSTQQKHRRHWAPALSGLAAAACALAVILILTGEDGRGPTPTPTDVAVRSSAEAAPATAPPATVRFLEKTSTAPPVARVETVAPKTTIQPQVVVQEKEAGTLGDVDIIMLRATSMDASGGFLRGMVRDAETGAPLPFANVIIKGTSRGAATDSLGWFEFAGLPAGSHIVQVLYLGYKPTEQTLVVVDSDTVEIQVALETTILETLGSIQPNATRYTVESMPAGPRDPGSGTSERHTMDSVNEAKSREADIIRRDSELYVRSGRAGEVHTVIDGRGIVNPTVGAESGGTRNPNDRPYDLVYHQHYGVNPFVATDEDALSTFAIEVDDASWTVARRYLTDGNLPPPEAIRLEEIVNRLDPGFTHTGDGDFSLHADGLPSRFGDGYQLLRVGVRARDIAAVDRRPAHLVFVIDISGSMKREDRLALVKKALRVLVNELQAGDRVGLVVYGSNAQVVLEPTGIENRDTILRAIDALYSGGSTNAEAGLRLAYTTARAHAVDGAINRLILCSDGVANVGHTAAESILEAVRRQADQGTSLTTIGFGMGNYNDVLMEQLANQGDGTYHYVQWIEDAERVFRHNLTGTLQTVGAEVKTQVEFDPEAVVRWRLLGYENRDVADEDFRNDTIDAGEIGANHAAVALYEIKLTDAATSDLERGRHRNLGTLRLRWAKPRYDDHAGEVTEIDRQLTTADLSTAWDQAAPRLRAASVAAEFAEILRKSYWARGSHLADLIPPVTHLVSELPADQDIIELSQMIRRATTLTPQD